MRMILAAMVAAAALAAGPAAAIEYPWCADYSVRGGATNCGFSTWEQCRATVSGIGGSCRRNAFYVGPEYQPAAEYRFKKHRHKKHRR